MIITILIAIVFFFLLAKALIETAWGLCMIAFGLFMHVVAFMLDGLALVVRMFNKIRRMFRKAKPQPQRVNMARAIALYHGGIR